MTAGTALGQNETAAHDCGLCDAPLAFAGPWHYNPSIRTWMCTECDWWHTSKDCCE